MAETIARIAPNGMVELATDGSTLIAEIGAISPTDAAYLARGLLASAAALSGTNPPDAGTIVGDAHFPVMTWRVGSSNFNGEPVMILSIPSGIELTFQMPSQGAKALGAALIAQGEGSAPPEGQRGTLH